MQKSIKTSLILGFFLLVILNAKSQNLIWASQIGGSSSEIVFSIAVNNDGSVYSIGEFSGTVDFDPGLDTFNLTSNGGNDIFISKLDASGNFIWASHFGGSQDDSGKSITVDPNGNIYSTGFFRNTVDFNSDTTVLNLVSYGNDDVFICKMNSLGELIWAKQMGGTSKDNGISLTADDFGNVYIVGNYLGTADLDPDSSSVLSFISLGSSDIFVSKLDTIGNFSWTKILGGSNTDEVTSITLDNSNNLVLCGHFRSTADFDPGSGTVNLISAGSFDDFVCKLDSLGDLIWAKKMGGISLDYAFDVAVDINDDIIVVGEFQGTSDFNPGAGFVNLISFGFDDIYICKLDANGNFIWVKQMGGTTGEIAFSVTTDLFGNIYTTGFFYETVDFDPGVGVFNLSTPGSFDTFIVKLDSLGIFDWAISLQPLLSNNIGYAIEIDSLGYIYNAGQFGAEADFDPGLGAYLLTSIGGVSDAYVWKLSEKTMMNIIREEEGSIIDIYPNPTDRDLTINLNQTFDRVTVNIRNLLSQNIVNYQFQNAREFKFQIEGESGVYIVEIITSNMQKYFFKVIKN